MFCSECGKTIDDEAVICPECGAITKKGVLTLQEAAKQGEAKRKQADSVNNYEIFSMVKPKDNSKTLRLVAMILGLAGSASLLSSLLGEFGSATVPIIGKYSVSVASYLDKMVILVVLLAGFSIAASLLKYSILQVVTGSITGGWIAYMICDLHHRASMSEVSGWVDVNFGIGTYLFILAACLMLASGIIYVVAGKNSTTNNDEKKAPKNKKTEIIVSIVLGVLVVCVIGVFIFIKSFQGTKEAKTFVGNFMNAAIHYEVDTMKGNLASDVNDKNGFMEAYTPNTMRDAFLKTLGVRWGSLKDKQKEAINKTGILFGENYLKRYDVTSVTKNSDGTFTIKAKAAIIDMSTTNEQIQKKSAERIADYAKQYPEVIDYVRQVYETDEELARFMALYLFDDMCSIIDNAIKSAGSMETEFTFVVKNTDGNYKIVEIDYKDE